MDKIALDCNGKEIKIGMWVESISDDRVVKVVDILEDNDVSIDYGEGAITVKGRSLLLANPK